jgi:hypothetical protein
MLSVLLCSISKNRGVKITNNFTCLFCFVGCYYVYQETNKVHKSSSIEIYYQCGQQATHTNMLLELFVQIISEPCFNILRTKEQLGRWIFGIKYMYVISILTVTLLMFLYSPFCIIWIFIYENNDRFTILYKIVK